MSGQSRVGVHACIAIKTEDEDSQSVLKLAQEELGVIMHDREYELDIKKAQTRIDGGSDSKRFLLRNQGILSTT